MKLARVLSLVAVCMLPLAALAASPIDGTWRGMFKGRDGAGYTLTFRFQVEGGKVRGSVEGDTGPTPILSGSIKDNSFEFTVKVNGTTVDHTCTVTGDTIDMTFRFGDQPPAKMTLVRASDAAAAAVPAAGVPDPTGLWKWTISPQGSGQTFDVSAKLAFSDGKLTGVYQSRMGEAPISDASFGDGAIAFSVVRERDGKAFTVKYKGVLSGDSIQGTVELPGFDGGESATSDWKATRSR